MKRPIPAIVFVFLAAGLGTWVTLNLRASAKYEQRKRGLSVSYKVTPFDEQFSGFLAEVERTWLVRTNTIGGPHSDGLRLAGMLPSAVNLSDLLTCPMPAWSWFSPQRNRQSLVTARFGVVRTVGLVS